MAKQKGIVKIKGTLDDLTFMKTKDGYLVKEKQEGITRDMINNNPDYIRIKENVSEFTRAGKATKQLRNAVEDVIKKSKDRRLTSRLTKVMMQVVKADSINVRGARKVTDGVLGFLKHFDFNANAPLQSTLKTKYNYQIDRVTGQMTVDVLPFKPLGKVLQPTGSTHFRIVSAALEIDFDSDFVVLGSSESVDIPISNTTTALISLQNAVTANSVYPLFLLLGIQFYQVVNGDAYPLTSKEFNALAILAVETV